MMGRYNRDFSHRDRPMQNSIFLQSIVQMNEPNASQEEWELTTISKI